MDDFQDQMFDVFVFETNTFLSQLEQILLNSEKDEVFFLSSVDEVFRIMHTIKSSAAMMGFENMSGLCHSMEDLFHCLKHEKVQTLDTKKLAQLLFECVDYLKDVINKGTDPEASILNENVSAFLKQLREQAVDQGGMCVENGRVESGKQAAPALNFFERRKDSSRGGEGLTGVKLNVLDEMVDLSGELVIASMSSLHRVREADIGNTLASLKHLHSLVLEMQALTLSTRMVSLKDTFYSLKRSLHDLSEKLGKEVYFSMSGEDEQIDRDIVSNISAPLLHLLKNAIDHGIEPAKERLAAGKSPIGSIHLSAEIIGKTAAISIEDDGRGIDKDAVLHTALDRCIISQAQADGMSDSEIINLILLPGFSTRSEVSEISGRGVGMDVVNDNIHGMNGRIAIETEFGAGTRIILKVPLTLATLDAIIVSYDNEFYTVPLSLVTETVRPRSENIQVLNGADTLMFRQECYPILSPYRFGNRPAADYENGNILIMESPEGMIALFVDEVVDHQSIVVKPVPPTLKGMTGIIGCTILGDGRVSLIIENEMHPVNSATEMVSD